MTALSFANIKSLFFDNRSIKQTIFKNTFWLGTGTAISKLFRFVLLVYTVRILGVTDYGKFSFAWSFISLFVIFQDFGLPLTVTRELSQNKEKEKEFPQILSLKIILSIITLALISIGLLFVTQDSATRKIIFILALFTITNGFLTIIYAFFQARQQMEHQAWLVILQSVVATIVGIGVLLKFPSVENLSYSYLFSGVVALIIASIFFNYKVAPLRISWGKGIWIRLLSISWPLAFTGLFGVLYSYTDSVMMGYWGMIKEVGWYNAADGITSTALLLMGFVSVSFYPVLSKFFAESKEKLQNALNNQLKIMIFLALPLVIGGIVLAPKIISFAYGAAFSPSILVFQILIITTGMIFLFAPYCDLLIASHQQKKIFYISAIGAAMNIIFNLIFIPWLSLYGAAIATLISTLIIFVLTLLSVKILTPISFFNLQLTKILISAILASSFMYFLIKLPLIYNLNVILVFVAGALVYFLAFFIFQIIIKRIKLILRRLFGASKSNLSGFIS